MARLLKQEVNIRNSFTWTKINDDARSSYWRNLFVNEHGGLFTSENGKFVWAKTEEIRKILVTKPDGTLDEVTNFAKYCREHDLNKGAMYEVIKGSRNHHKGFIATKGER